MITTIHCPEVQPARHAHDVTRFFRAFPEAWYVRAQQSPAAAIMFGVNQLGICDPLRHPFLLQFVPPPTAAATKSPGSVWSPVPRRICFTAAAPAALASLLSGLSGRLSSLNIPAGTAAAAKRFGPVGSHAPAGI
eukprot:CAMPEP_0184736426 /NCGR_PEP_ID=MMETSP0314-20130426/62395_1 /TAXON_ID=38298 /ORGANISM="Rhodella maculata, Strain CCMP 736" /LENGTH=134 /DNA_ID=CAMNT_0027203485 /DNA_START=63 /DNA_END=467 /DNA_ORIENTATION=-